MSMSVSFKKTDIYDEWVEEYEIFENLYDAVMFMAVLGYANDSVERQNFRGSKDGVGQGNIRIESFYSNDLYQVIGGCLAYQDTNDPDALVKTELQAKIISQYATGGVAIAQSEFGDISGDPTDAIVNYIDEFEDDPDGTGPSILTQIRENFDNEMLNSDSE
ncbi:hypothetical protein C475_19593 [Halosimplex carlsbadense 2-9-1]|uniref:Uncharacterized protein n=1 Tax=Halosimplex carlsbadense 2-9-1 TaxID=797114 RepID=M0CC22_9EURY|nr:hypothetical protein [Halosimplex carlsbadense]ELZ20836.1 hypothetical protein C475_19593 [Halosimplex carlsbadense 2-9-1]